METQQSAVKHPLIGKEVTHIQTWGEWKERWENESCTEILHSLLHFGFSVPADRDEVVERLCLYFEIADKGNERSRNVFPNEDYCQFPAYKAFGLEVNTKAGLREVLSQKAFQMLCQNFFKNTAEQTYHLPSWVRMIILPPVLAKVFWFFRMDYLGDIVNLDYVNDSEYHKQIARNFAHELCLFVWDCGNWGAYGGYRELTEEVRATFFKARPDVITLLAGLDELGLLLNGNRYKEMDKPCLKKLESLTFDYELWLPDASEFHGERRRPRTIEEACVGRSQAARVLLVLRTLLSEKERFDKMQELEKQRREAEKKLADLKKKK